MRTEFSSCLSKVRWMVPLLVLLIGAITTSASATTRSALIATHAHTAAEIPGFSRFVGFWYSHGGTLAVDADGRAHFRARTYVWCGPGVKPPCDTIQDMNGYKAELQFSRVDGDVAYGTITSGNVQPVGSGATMELLLADQAFFSPGLLINRGGHLCGPRAPSGACGA